MQYLTILGFIVQMVSAVIYCRAIIAGSVTPDRVSWLLWATIPFVAATIALRDGARWSVLPIFAAGLAPAIVLIFAINRRSGAWHPAFFSMACLCVSLIALFVELIGFGFIATIAVLIAEFAATLPTIRKSWRYPRTESSLAYVLSAISASTALLAIRVWNVQQAAFPMLVVILMLVIVSILIFRRKESVE
ncbi:MAG: hypothetical protein FWF45_03345 [Coriobacteriia bacterium]|nr:hypothetical protein [Coriobacteriia bacterium]